MLRAYVSDIAESFAEASRADEDARAAGRWVWRGEWTNGEIFRSVRRKYFFGSFLADPSLRSGGILFFDREGRFLGGSHGSERLAVLWRGLPYSGSGSVSDAEGNSYHAAARELANGHYVLVAVSAANILSSISHVWNIWLVSIMATSAAVLAGIAALWRYFALPIRRIVETVAGTKWGEETPRFEKEPLYEVDELSNVIERAASDAVAREQLRLKYISDIVRAQEDAKRRLARELHDGPLQTVIAAIKRVQLAQIGGEPAENLHEAERISQYAANEIRNYCDELSPSWFALGLTSALDEMCERLSRAYNVRITVSSEDFDTKDLPDEYILSVIRIFQESVSNSVRHGGATEIEALLVSIGDEMVFTVSDNGKGLGGEENVLPDYEKLRIDGHRGLSNMHERAQLLGGKLEISSTEKGCAITLFVNTPHLH
jgi:signal transduction histidine kinase